MGTWGAALYDDDSASDQRDSLALMCKVPVPGDRLLELLKELYGDCDPTDEDGALFWLVTADQFERRGIECTAAASTALSIIQGGGDLVRAREKGADEAFLKKRAVVLQDLAKRLRSPRRFRPRVPPRHPPSLVVATEKGSDRRLVASNWARGGSRVSADGKGLRALENRTRPSTLSIGASLIRRTQGIAVSGAFLAFAASDCNGWDRLWGLAQGREWRRTKVSGRSAFRPAYGG